MVSNDPKFLTMRHWLLWSFETTSGYHMAKYVFSGDMEEDSDFDTKNKNVSGFIDCGKKRYTFLFYIWIILSISAWHLILVLCRCVCSVVCHFAAWCISLSFRCYSPKCPWCNGYRRRKWTRRHDFKSWTRLIVFHIALIPLEKVWIQLFSLHLWINSRAD